jgi:uncharacterized membrane protein YfcA
MQKKKNRNIYFNTVYLWCNMEFITHIDLTLYQWLVAALTGIFVGMTKTGVTGLGMLNVVLFAAIFGGKPSTGLLLPMLCFADIFAVKYYHRHAEWKYIIRLLPSALAGIVIAVYVGDVVSSSQFNMLLGLMVLAGLVIIIWREVKLDDRKIPDYRWFSILMGVIGGFTTMFGNAAGPVITIFLLSMRLPKNSYIGTGAWFFMIVNLIKVPFHVFVWQTISFDLVITPFIALGAVAGILLIKKVPERVYRLFIIVITSIAAVKLLL